jgi:hypothetical protein
MRSLMYGYDGWGEYDYFSDQEDEDRCECGLGEQVAAVWHSPHCPFFAAYDKDVPEGGED